MIKTEQLDFSEMTDTLQVYSKRANFRIRELQQILDNISGFSEEQLQGSLIARHYKGKLSYYRQYRKDGKTLREYLRISDPRIPVLAKKEYCEKSIRLLQNNTSAISDFLRRIIPQNEADLADTIHRDKIAFCEEFYISKSRVIADFLAMSSQSGYQSQNLICKTLRGELVRSKSEVNIADSLYRHDIIYLYEFPLHLKNGKIKLVDFAILDLRTMKIIYWEHLGMMGNVEYANRNVEKINDYIESGIIPGKNLILTFETERVPLSTSSIEQIIQKCLL